MIHLSLVALSLALIGLQCRRLAATAEPRLRPTETLSDECLREMLAQLHRDYPATNGK